MRRETGHHVRQTDAAIGGSGSVFHLTWIGPASGACAALLERVRGTCLARGQRLRIHFEPLDSAVLHSALRSFDSGVVAWADRVIVASETRLDYPWRIVELLERLDAAVPWGVVTGSWHGGSRRTGIGAVTHWQLPWYRWWEAWYGWFFPELARPASRCATQFEAVTVPIDLATPAKIATAILSASSDAEAVNESGHAHRPWTTRAILLIAACRDTLQGWQLSAASVGWNPIAQHPQFSSKAMPDAGDAAPECILWDDSCQDRLPGDCVRLEQACRQIEQLKRRYPGVPIIAGLSLAHLSAWSQLQRAGASDFIIKPSFGLPLADYLMARDFGSAKQTRRCGVRETHTSPAS